MNAPARDEGPRSEPKGHATIDGKWLLTHAIWCPTTFYGRGRCPETGVCKIDTAGMAVEGTFELIQHGWHNFSDAEQIISRGLRKGWDCYRIATLMDNLSDRRRRK